jgi:hypothetical protein
MSTQVRLPSKIKTWALVADRSSRRARLPCPLILCRLLIITFAFALTAGAGENDALLAQAWQQEKFVPNPPANHEIFVCRIHLDIIGRIPTMQVTP